MAQARTKAKSAATKAAQSARPKTQTARQLASCGCSREWLVAIILTASVVAGVAIACGILGVPVTPTGTVPVRIDDSPGPLPPGPGPDPFRGLADAVAAEARNVDSRNRDRECTTMADAIERYLDRQLADSLESLFTDLRRATSSAIPPRSAEAWRPFNHRVDELLAAEFDSGRLTTVTDGVGALRAVADGLRDAAGRF